MQKNTISKQETIDLGQNIAAKLKGGDIVLLHGDLGSGKTTLTKGIAKYFGIEEVVSPTFTLMQAYHLSTSAHKHISMLVHIDTYRLEDEYQLVEIGVEDYLGDKNTVCVVEWPEKMGGLLRNKKTINITIEPFENNGRRIKIEDY